MDWRKIDFDWNQAKALLVTAELGSYSAAARALATTQPTIGRQIAALEAHLGVVLVERVGRGIALTPQGEALVAHAHEMGEAARRLALTAQGGSSKLEGVVTVTAGEAISVYLLSPIVADLCARHPGLQIDVVATSQVANLRRREADIAVRNFRPEDEELVATRLPEDQAFFYGTPAYLDQIGHPQAGDDLAHVQFVGWDRTPRLPERLAGHGVRVAADQFRVASGNQLLQWALVQQGFGLGLMMARIGDADPGLRRALPGMTPIPVPLWLTTHRAVRTSRRIRVVFDALAAAFRAPDFQAS